MAKVDPALKKTNPSTPHSRRVSSLDPAEAQLRKA